jgi:hypothetical protein
LELVLVPHKIVDMSLEKYKFGAISSGITFISNAVELRPVAAVEMCECIGKMSFEGRVPSKQISQRTFNSIIIIIIIIIIWLYCHNYSYMLVFRNKTLVQPDE